MIKNFTHKLNFFYLFFVLVFEPLKQIYLPFDGGGRIIVFLTILVYASNFGRSFSFFKKNVFSKPTIYWFLLIVYSSINLFFSGYSIATSFFLYIFQILIIPFTAMLVTRIEMTRNYKKTLNFIFYLILSFALTFLITSYQNLFNNTIERKEIMGGFGNSGPLVIMYLFYFGCLQYLQKKISKLKLLGIFAFVLFVISIVATRKAFVALLIFYFFFHFSKNKFKFQHLIKTIVVFSLLAFVLIQVVNSSALGKRFERGLEEGNELNETNIEFLSLLGDRAIFYSNIGIVRDNIFTGIGLKNYPSYTNTRLNLHSEYLSHFIENGLIGFMIFLGFYFSFYKLIRNTLKYKNHVLKPIFVASCGGYASLLFVNFTAWTYSGSQYFIALGVILGLSDVIKNQSKMVYEK